MRHLVWLLALALMLPACAQKATSSKNKPTIPAQAAEPVLVFQRTPCFGSCPYIDYLKKNLDPLAENLLAE